MSSLLVFCLLGSYVNIPIAELPAEQMRSGQIVDYGERAGMNRGQFGKSIHTAIT